MRPLIGLAVAMAAVAAVLSGRFFQIQVVEGRRWAQVVERAQLVQEPLPPLRGRILDRHGRAMADTRPLYHLAVVIEDFELGGRARRVPLLVLDRQRWLALGGELGRRMAFTGLDRVWHEQLATALLAEPSVAVRGARTEDAPGSLVTVPRALFAGADGDDAELALLAGSDLLHDDPRAAVARELSQRRAAPVQVFDDDRLRGLCAQLDAELGLDAGRTWSLLLPYTAVLACEVPSAPPPAALPGALPDAGPRPFALNLRWLTGNTLDQALGLLANLLDDGDPGMVRSRWQRLVAAMPAAPLSGQLLYGAGSDAEAIAPRIPGDLRLGEVPLPAASDPERIFIIQGDGEHGDGALSLVVRRTAAALGVRQELLDELLRRHAEAITPGIAERRWGRRHVVVDAHAIDRLCERLASRLAGSGADQTAGEWRALIAQARRTADRERAGATRFDPILIRRDLPAPVARRLDGTWVELPRDLLLDGAAQGPDLPGIRVVPGIGRAWPAEDSAVHLIGMLAPDPEPLWPGALVGVTGLEQRYDRHLRGSPGQRVRRREPEGLRDVGAPLLPVAGRDLVTEIDLDLQQVAEDALGRRLELARAIGAWTERMERAARVGRGRAGVVVMDVQTGGLLVLASHPRYRPDELRTRWHELARDPAGPLHDWSCEADQPPGSSFKILTMLAGLELGVVSPGEQIATKGYMMLDRQGNKILRDHAPPGVYDLAEGIQRSSNEYSAVIAERIHRAHGPGWLSGYARRFGLGQRPGLDIGQARAGILPTPESVRRIRPENPRWMLSDTWRMGIGQFCAASPLQVVTIAAAVANGGRIVRPHLVRPESGVVSEDLGVRKDWLEEVRRGMEHVTEPGGTARLLRLEGAAAGIEVAAKTGTAEWGTAQTRASEQTPDHAWMIGYAPADRPTVAFAVFVHSGTFGGLACTPIIKQILEAYFARYGRGGHLAGG